MNVKESDLNYLKLKAIKGAEVSNAIIRKVDEILGDEEPQITVTAERKEDHILLHLTGNVQDIQYSIDNGKTHSVQWMLHNGYSPPKIEGDTYRIGKVSKILKKFFVTVGSGEWDKELNTFIFDEEKTDRFKLLAVEENPGDGDEPEPVPQPEPEPKKLDIFTALWYDNNVPDTEFKRLMTSGHHAGPNKEPLQKVLDYGHRLIPTVGGFKPSDTNYQLRQKVRNREATFRSLGFENIDAIIYRDEPHAKGFTVEQLEVIVDEGLKVYGEDIRATFPFTIDAILKQELPKNLNTVWINGYPLFKKGSKEGYAKIFDFESIRSYMNNLYNTAKQKVPGADIIVTAQVFGTVTDDEPPWRIPEPETAEWYMRVIAEHPEIVGLTFWAYEPTDDRWAGLAKLPELEQAWITAIKKWTK